MGAKICPICDTKVNKINFCPECKRFVTPKEMSQNFYLNEKRPDGDDTNQSQKSKQRNQKKASELLTGIVVAIAFIGIWVGFLCASGYQLDFGYNDSNDNTTIDYDADIPDYEDIVGGGYGNYVNKAEGDSALTDEQVEEDGNACTMYGHYDGISAVSFMDELTGCAEAYDLTLTFNKSYGYKNLYTYSTGNEVYTCYELCDVFATSGLGRDGIATYYDYNTDEIHGIYAWAKVDAYSDGSAILSIFNCMIDALDDSNLSGGERDNVIQYLEKYIAKSDFTLEADDAVQISVGDWNIYVGRTTTNVYVELAVAY